jgi:hypothetical protein
LNRRIATVNPTCSVCGCVVEDSHHALISCTVARALREELRTQWVLPDELAFRVNQNEWIFALLDNATKDQRSKIIFLLWRVWHHRNNIVHGDGKASVSASVPYLVNYHRSFTEKGGEEMITAARWSPPPNGSVKANVDAGWDPISRIAGIVLLSGTIMATLYSLNGNPSRCVGVQRRPRSSLASKVCANWFLFVVGLRCWSRTATMQYMR